MFNYILEAKRILKQLSYQIEEAEKFLLDEEFIKCLADEIKESKDIDLATAIFEISDKGEIYFKGIDKPKEDLSETHIIIPLKNINEAIKISEEKEIVEKAAEKAKEVLDLDLTLKKKELIDKLLKKTD